MKIRALKFRPAVLFDAVFLALVCLCYGYWAFDGLPSQGIYCDIGLLGRKAAAFLEGTPSSGHHFVTWAGRSIPLMLLDYHGPVEIYLTIPWIALLGRTALALHIGPVLAGFLTIPLFYAVLLKVHGDRWVPCLASALLFTSVSYVAGCRLGLYTGTFLLFFLVGFLWGVLKWRETGRTSWLVSASFLLGLGLGSRIFFVWFLAALLAAACFKVVREGARALSRRQVLACAAAVTVGVLPVFLSNVLNGFYTVSFLLKNSVVSADGVSNLAYPANLLGRIGQVRDLLSGSAYSVASNPVNWPLFAGAFAAAAGWALRERFSGRKAPFRVEFPLAMFGAILLLSPLTPSGLQPLHLYQLLPFASWIVAATVCLPRSRPGRRAARYALVLITAASVACNIRAFSSGRAHRWIHGGHEVAWNVLGDVVQWLAENRIRRIGLADTGIMDPIRYLDGGLDAEEIFWAPYMKMDRDAREDRLRERLSGEEEGYYLSRPPGREWVPYLSRLSEIAAEEGKSWERIHEFKAPQEGAAVFRVYRAR